MLSRLGVALCLLGLSAPAHAQIYSWRDDNGNLVLSNRRPGDPAPLPSYTVAKADGIRATRSAVADRARAYDDLITEQSRFNGVRPALVRAVMEVESGFNPYARSPKGAMGLMQLMPATARQYGVENAYNAAENIRAGVAYLRGLLDRYDNNEELALAAYNAGTGAVDKHGQRVPPYRETKSYVSQIGEMAGRPTKVPDHSIYKVTDVIDGREIPKYTDKKPTP